MPGVYESNIHCMSLFVVDNDDDDDYDVDNDVVNDDAHGRHHIGNTAVYRGMFGMFVGF